MLSSECSYSINLYLTNCSSSKVSRVHLPTVTRHNDYFCYYIDVLVVIVTNCTYYRYYSNFNMLLADSNLKHAKGD